MTTICPTMSHLTQDTKIDVTFSSPRHTTVGYSYDAYQEVSPFMQGESFDIITAFIYVSNEPFICFSFVAHLSSPFYYHSSDIQIQYDEFQQGHEMIIIHDNVPYAHSPGQLLYEFYPYHENIHLVADKLHTLWSEHRSSCLSL